MGKWFDRDREHTNLLPGQRRDKLEKANYFLEQIIDTADQDLDSRLVQTLVQAPLSDGGQWDMVYNLVAKYGLGKQASKQQRQ